MCLIIFCFDRVLNITVKKQKTPVVSLCDQIHFGVFSVLFMVTVTTTTGTYLFYLKDLDNLYRAVRTPELTVKKTPLFRFHL